MGKEESFQQMMYQKMGGKTTSNQTLHHIKKKIQNRLQT